MRRPSCTNSQRRPVGYMLRNQHCAVHVGVIFEENVYNTSTLFIPMSRPLDIAIACRAMGHSVGGVREYVREMVHELVSAKSPHRFTLYYADRDLMGTHASGAREIFLDAPHKAVWDHWALPRALANQEPDVVWFPQNVVSLGLRCASVVTLLDLLYFRIPEFPHREYLWPDIAYMRAMIPRSTRIARRVTCISEHTAFDARRILGVSPEKMEVIPIAPSRVFLEATSPLQDTDTKKSVMEKYGMRRPFFLYAGTRSIRKNIRLLFEAFASCHRDIPHDLVLTGGGGHVVVEDRAEDVLDRHQIRERVRVLGLIPQADLIALYRAADAFVFPSRYEGFGLPPLEAMACGCPVISSHATSLSEVVGDAALTFDPSDAPTLAAHMRHVALDPELRARLTARGLERVTLFSYARSAQALLRVLEEATTTESHHRA